MMCRLTELKPMILRTYLLPKQFFDESIVSVLAMVEHKIHFKSRDTSVTEGVFIHRNGGIN